MTLPEIRSYLLAAQGGLGDLFAEMDPYRPCLPGIVLWGLREARLRIDAALSCLDHLDEPLAYAKRRPPPSIGSDEVQG
jgi:hypothetical protein